MRVIVLGSNKYAIGIIKKAFMSNAEFISVFEKDDSLLMDLKEELNKELGDI
ncbi:hypothetical protein HUG20_10515 [Salicibibacter cibi]|uniref:Uncharacterized protein n=1 Tax=Salicibibacter cibi TaxID=2743001 RepID=A0A7T7CFL4_9BACI|nr:hypothetical protein [Salicibibacter cibi]QQK80282.1 hypothetical protein HUG20_10515 [Salicibibacter cibi]